MEVEEGETDKVDYYLAIWQIDVKVTEVHPGGETTDNNDYKVVLQNVDTGDIFEEYTGHDVRVA